MPCNWLSEECRRRSDCCRHLELKKLEVPGFNALPLLLLLPPLASPLVVSAQLYLAADREAHECSQCSWTCYKRLGTGFSNSEVLICVLGLGQRISLSDVLVSLAIPEFGGVRY